MLIFNILDLFHNFTPQKYNKKMGNEKEGRENTQKKNAS